MNVAQSNLMDELASGLLAARRSAKPVGDVDAYGSIRSINDGLNIVSCLTALLAQEGVSITGLKLGALDAPAQHALGLDRPIVAPFYEEWTMASGARLSLKDLIAPKLECEIGFQLAHEGWIPVACIELADSRLPGWSGRGGQVLADFGLNGAIIQGSKLDPSKEMSFVLSHDGVVVVKEKASLNMAHGRIDTYTRGTDTKYVASGSLHPPLAVEEGEWSLQFLHGGEVTLIITG